MSNRALKLGRNDPCHCGSGKKFKKCCLNEENTCKNDNEIDEIYHTYKQLLRKSRIKQCIHPKKEECSNNIILAHSIQRNRYLSSLAKDGEVIMASLKLSKKPEYTADKVGIKKTTTFSGFCGFHDSELFKPIEEISYKEYLLQNFLFAYRAFAIEYHKKLEAIQLLQNHLSQKPEIILDDTVQGQLEGYRLALLDFEKTKRKFDNCIEKQDFGNLHTTVLCIDSQPSVAVCAGFLLEYDLNGKPLLDPESIDFYVFST